MGPFIGLSARLVYKSSPIVAGLVGIWKLGYSIQLLQNYYYYLYLFIVIIN